MQSLHRQNGNGSSSPVGGAFGCIVGQSYCPEERGSSLRKLARCFPILFTLFLCRSFPSLYLDFIYFVCIYALCKEAVSPR